MGARLSPEGRVVQLYRSAILFASVLVSHSLPASTLHGIEETADISVGISDGRHYVQPGDVLVYRIRVQNAGPDDAMAFVSDTLPAGLEAGFWDCVEASPGATCASGNGASLFDTAFLPAGGHVEYEYFTAVGAGPHMAPIANAVTAFGHLELIDPQANNIASDTPADIVVLFRAGFDP
jgi:uncharacterized repeat protein (TIGR01451 family)